MDFAEARYYQNQLGRFTAVDPLLASGKSANPQTFNRYVYVLNSPLVLADPSGLQAGTPSGRWYKPTTPDGKKPYRYESSTPEGYEAVTERSKAGDLIGSYSLTDRDQFGRPDFVVRFNEMGPRKPLPTVNLSNGQKGFETLSSFDRNGWEYALGDGYQFLHPSTGAVRDVTLETVMAVQGAAAMVRAGVSAGVARSFATQEGGAVFYSGGRGAAGEWATEFAANTGRQTIEMTPGGRMLNSITNAHVGNFSIRDSLPTLNNRVWEFGSRQFANGASGQVHIFRSLPVRPGNAFGTIEEPILSRSVNVFRNYHQVPR